MRPGNRTTGRAILLAATGTAAAAAVAGLTLPAGAAPAAPAAAAAHRAATVSGTEHFQLITTSATSNTLNALAWGPFAATGTDHEGNSNTNTSTDLLKLNGGSFKITHTVKSEKQSINSKTCFLSVIGKGTYKISAGTGAYKGISGSGTFTLTVYAIAAKTKKGACNESANPIGFQNVVTASGPVKLP